MSGSSSQLWPGPGGNIKQRHQGACSVPSRVALPRLAVVPPHGECRRSSSVASCIPPSPCFEGVAFYSDVDNECSEVLCCLLVFKSEESPASHLQNVQQITGLTGWLDSSSNLVAPCLA